MMRWGEPEKTAKGRMRAVNQIRDPHEKALRLICHMLEIRKEQIPGEELVLEGPWQRLDKKLAIRRREERRPAIPQIPNRHQLLLSLSIIRPLFSFPTS